MSCLWDYGVWLGDRNEGYSGEKDGLFLSQLLCSSDYDELWVDSRWNIDEIW